MKVCTACGAEKDDLDFYRKKYGKRMSVCKKCRIKQVIAGRDKGSRRVSTDLTPEQLQYYRSLDCDSYLATRYISDAIRDGILVEQPCEVCRKHAVPYLENPKQLDKVRWFCRSHLVLFHGRNNHGKSNDEDPLVYCLQSGKTRKRVRAV